MVRMTSWRGPVVALGLTLAGLGAAAQAAEAPTAIVDAAKRGDWKAVNGYLQQGAGAATAAVADGTTALHWASYADISAAAAALIKAGAKVNAVNYLGATPLWLAAENGSAAMTQVLLQAGADPNLALVSGETPLMTASRTGNPEVVKQLIAKGANVNAAEKIYGKQTALMWAVAERHPAVVALLLDAGADVKARTDSWKQRVKTSTPAQNHPEYIVDVMQGGTTPLLFAALSGDVESAKLLVAKGADINDRSAFGTSATVLAAHSGYGDVAKFLLEKGANPNLDDAGYTALHAAILREDDDLVDALLKHGADPNAPVKKATPVRRQSADWFLPPAFVGATPYWLAARFGESRSMRLLAAAGANTKIVHKVEYWDEGRGYAIERIAEGNTNALMAAVGMGHVICACPTDHVDSHRPSLPESEERRLEAVKVAVEFGADLNAANADGDTALHFVAGLGYDSIVKFLVEKGASLDIKNGRGRTPLGAAMTSRSKPKSTIDYLTGLGAKP